VRYQHNDALDSSVAETNEQAAVVLRMAYTPYGVSMGGFSSSERDYINSWRTR